MSELDCSSSVLVKANMRILLSSAALLLLVPTVPSEMLMLRLEKLIHAFAIAENRRAALFPPSVVLLCIITLVSEE